MSCAGDPNIDTPNMDRLQNEGLGFRKAYSNSPICTAARSCIHTGQYITSSKCLANHMPLLPTAGPQMAQVMREAGYRTCHYGKWHLSGGSVRQHFVSPYFRPGWDEWIGWECMHGHAGLGTYSETFYGEGDEDIRPKQIDKYQADWLADRSVAWLEKQNAETPWFHVLSIETPHDPWDVPRNVPWRQFREFEAKKLQWRPNVDEEMRIIQDQNHRSYLSQIKNIDDNIGRILQTLEETGQLENTVVFYFSDHGDFMGSHGRRLGKESPLEESSNIPLVVRLPGCLDVEDGRDHTPDALISLIDLMPTSLGLCGIPVPESCDGQDLSDYFLGRSENCPDSVYLQFELYGYFGRTVPKGFWRTLHKGDWKYSVDHEVGALSLYNLGEDPYEMNNLVNQTEAESRQREMNQQIRVKAEEIGDDFFTRLDAQLQASC